MIEISSFYINYNNEPIIFTFIKYNNFYKIILDETYVIIAINKLKNYKLLFQYYIFSLLCTIDYYDENNSNICCVNSDNDNDNFIYTNFDDKCNYYYYFIKLYKAILKKMFIANEPIIETSIEKLNKIINLIYFYYNNNHINYPLKLIDKYQKHLINDIDKKINKIIEYENKIYLLSCIRGFNKDIYYNIKKFLYI
jgi:hypothetical protein